MPGYKTVGYFTNWGIYGRNFKPENIPATHITHVLYSFANVRPDTGEVFLTDPYADLDMHYPTDSWNDVGTNVYGCVKQLYLLKKRNRKLKTLLSIGGWSYSANFAGPASTPAGRSKFASSAVTLMKDLGFDGIDIDWEQPQDASQAQNYVYLIAETRRQVDAYSAANNCGKRMLLTVAVPAGPSNFQKLLMAQMDPYLDFWNLMAYDFAGAWDCNSGHQANIYPSSSNPGSTPFCADAAVKGYIAGGVPSKKLILGMPLYGRAFDNTNGPGQPFSSVGEGSWENGIWDYKALPQVGAVEANDETIISSYGYNNSTRKMISYDTPKIAKAKANYIKNKSLGGGMWWELSGDYPISNPRSLIATTVNTLGGIHILDTGENTLNYPQSKYDNLRKQMGYE